MEGGGGGGRGGGKGSEEEKEKERREVEWDDKVKGREKMMAYKKGNGSISGVPKTLDFLGNDVFDESTSTSNPIPRNTKEDLPSAGIAFHHEGNCDECS